MLGIILSIFIFNSVAFIIVKQLKRREIIHIWIFTFLLHAAVDVFLSLWLDGYWYFEKGVQWVDVPAVLLISPPNALLFIDRYPFGTSLSNRLAYILFWSLLITVYEAITLLPEPWGFFHYNWWNLAYSAIAYPFLFSLLIFYYKSAVLRRQHLKEHH